MVLSLVEVRPRSHLEIYKDVDAARLRHWKPSRDRAGVAGCTRTLSLSCEISSHQTPTMSCLSSRHASWSVTCQLERKMVISATAPPRSYSPADKGRR